MKQLKAALIGLGSEGRHLYQALLTDPLIELIAVADQDRELAARLGAEAGAAAYDDSRLAVVESATRGLEALFVALPPFEADECIRRAAAAETAVFTLPPPARCFEAGRELAELFASAGRPLVVARPWQFEPAYMQLHDLNSLAGHVFAGGADLTCPAYEAHDWRGDSRRAGGGVLLHGGYEMVDAVVTLLGVPSEVYATLGFAVPPGETRPYDTEDAASMVCHYSDERTATIACRRGGTAAEWSIRLYGSKASVTVTSKSMTVTDREGGRVTHTTVHTTNRLGPAVNVFTTSLASGVSRMPSSVTEHLATMATIRAAYLSTRTGQHESPGKFLELAGVGER